MEVLVAHLDEASVALGEVSGGEGAFGPFAISEKTKQTIEILEDVPYSYEDWIEENVSKDSWSTKILKFWFLFSKKHNSYPEMQFPQLFDDDSFIAKVAKGEIGKFEEEETGKVFLTFLGKYLEEIYTQFDFSSENLYKVSILLKVLGDAELINPHHTQNDSNIGSFMAFILADACKHANLEKAKNGFSCAEKRNEVLEYFTKEDERKLEELQALSELLA